MIGKLIFCFFALLMTVSSALAQDRKTNLSVDMRQGTQPPELPTKNPPPDFPPAQVQGEEQMRKLNVSEVTLKRKRWSKQKGETKVNPEASPTPIQQR